MWEESLRKGDVRQGGLHQERGQKMLGASLRGPQQVKDGRQRDPCQGRQWEMGRFPPPLQWRSGCGTGLQHLGVGSAPLSLPRVL